MADNIGSIPSGSKYTIASPSFVSYKELSLPSECYGKTILASIICYMLRYGSASYVVYFPSENIWRVNCARDSFENDNGILIKSGGKYIVKFNNNYFENYGLTFPGSVVVYA